MMYANFELSEFTESDTARKRRIDNTPSSESIAHIGELVGSILQPLRDAWRGPIKVTSGYRSPALNSVVGGVSTSAHQYGFAADIQPNDMDDFPEFVDFVRKWIHANGIKYDQCIVESSSSAEWVHIGVRNKDGKQRMQMFNMYV